MYFPPGFSEMHFPLQNFLSLNINWDRMLDKQATTLLVPAYLVGIWFHFIPVVGQASVMHYGEGLVPHGGNDAVQPAVKCATR